MSPTNPESNPPEDTGTTLSPAEEARAVLTQRIITSVLVLAALGAGFYLYRMYTKKPPQKEKVIYAPEAPLAPTKKSATLPKIPLRDVTSEAGISFKHTTGATGQRLLPETMGGGAAFFDYDKDGDPDLFLVNSCAWPGAATEGVATHALYRNDGGKFVDVTSEARLDRSFYGQGVAAADYDGDGWIDLFVTAVGGNHLFRNTGDKKFVDVTETAGVGGNGYWSTGAAFLDYDGDGLLDLFVANYVTWSREIDLSQSFQLTGIGRAYGPPTGFKGAFAVLYKNMGGGKFEDVSAAAGVQVKNRATGVPMGKSLGVCVCDVNEDGRPDVLVANDTVQNFAFVNRGNGMFAEMGRELSFAFDDKGSTRGAMGIDCGDFRNDGSMAVVVGNFANEMDAFYVSDRKGDPSFIDSAVAFGIGAPSRSSLTFGVLFVDIDLDGRLDYITANGHVEPEIGRVQESQHHEQAMELFWNGGPEAGFSFILLGDQELGPDFRKPLVGRGLLTADYDLDGDLDLLVTQNGGSPRLLRNEISGKKSLRLDIRTKDDHGTAIGAKVAITTAAGRQRRFIGQSSSYLSQSEQIATFGLGSADEAKNIEIRWPSGHVRYIERLPAGLHVIREE